MTACAHCNTVIPADYGGATCPGCKTRLPATTGGRRVPNLTPLSGLAVDPALLAAGRSRKSDKPPSVRPPVANADDRWDMPDDPAPAPVAAPTLSPQASMKSPATPSEGIAASPGPSGFGRPGAAPKFDGGSTLALDRGPGSPAPASAGMASAPVRRAPATTVMMGALPPALQSDPALGGVTSQPIETRALGRMDAGEAERVLASTHTMVLGEPSLQPGVPANPTPNGSTGRPAAALPTPPPPGIGSTKQMETPPVRRTPDAPLRSVASTLMMAPPLASAAPIADAGATGTPVVQRRAVAQTLIGTPAVKSGSGAGADAIAASVASTPAAPLVAPKPLTASPVSALPTPPPFDVGATLIGTSAPRPARLVPVGEPPVTPAAATTENPPSAFVAPASAVATASVPPIASSSPGAISSPSLRAVSGPDRTSNRSAAHATATSSPVPGTARHRPVLASDVLRDDLVPREPGRGSMRVVLGLGGLLLLLASAASASHNVQSLAAWAIPGVTAILVALVPIAYGTRALLAFAPALPALAVQSATTSGATLTSALLFTGVCSMLPASLLFRASFRASRRARYFVGAGIALAVAWALHPYGGAPFAATPAGVHWALAHIQLIGVSVIALLSLMAFMDNNTTGGCRTWAFMAVLWSGISVFARLLEPTMTLSPLPREAFFGAASILALSAISAVSVAGLLAVYARPSEPNTGIGLGASNRDSNARPVH